MRPVATKVVLFDMGGVLLDFQGAPGFPVGKLDFRGREALLHYLADRGSALSEEDLDQDLFAPWRREFDRRHETGQEADWGPHLRRLRKRAGVRTPTRTLLGVWFRPLAEVVEPLAGALDALETLARDGRRLAIVSNVPLPGPLYRAILERHGMAEYFARMYFSYDEGHRKPSPALVRRALSDLGVAPGEAALIGDRRSVDVVAGRSAGVRTIWLRSEDGGGPKADREIDELFELPALV